MSIYAAIHLPVGLDQTLSVPKVSQIYSHFSPKRGSFLYLVYIGYSDTAGGIYFWAKLSLYPIFTVGRIFG